ncbi:MAG: transporter ATP-binding protein [Modestobacter sp.]|nr:transporter ATP-binding protein [Modestobacter sp.]
MGSTRQTSEHGADPAAVRDRVSAPVEAAGELFRRFWPLTRPDRTTLLAAAVLLIAAAAADTVAVLMFMNIVDGAVASGRMSAYWVPAGTWIGVAVLAAVATAIGSYLSARAAERFLLRLRDDTFGHLQRLSPDFFERHPTGDLVARFSGDIETIETLVSSGVVQAAASLVTVVFFAGAAFWLRWELALVVVALLPLLVQATRHFSARFRTTTQDERTSNGAISDVVEQGIANVALIQAYATEQVEAGRLHTEGRAWMQARLAQMRLTATYTPLTDMVESLAVVAVLGVGTWEISQGRLSLGGLIAFATFLGFLYSPMQRLSGLVLSVTAARASSDRLAEVLDTPPTVADPPNGITTPAREGRLTLMGLGFTYPGARRPALSGLSVEVTPGRLVLVTGPSGAGKSTIARLLLRFYDPTAGRILLDGIDLRDRTLAGLRHSVTLLPQETVVLDGTVAENIAYGSPGARPPAIADAARAAHAEEFISRLPDGYGTRLGSRGPQLSGGQRQRIAVARALLRDTPVLVLDEPTTGLDATATAAVVPALRALMRGRTTVLISHDLRLGPLADDVLVIDRGRLVERGTHADLLRLGGLYARLHHHQYGPVGPLGPQPEQPRSAPATPARVAVCDPRRDSSGLTLGA